MKIERLGKGDFVGLSDWDRARERDLKKRKRLGKVLYTPVYRDREIKCTYWKAQNLMDKDRRFVHLSR